MDDAIKQLTDEELALESGAGSHSSFEELVFRYTPRLNQFLRQKTADPLDAEDLTQETFIKAYRNIEKYDSRWKFSTWLYTIAVRTAVSHFRASRVRETVPLPLSHSLDSREHDDELIMQIDRRNLWLLARRLKPDQYDALWLRYTEEMTVKEIATVMKKSSVHVRVLLHRARANMAKLASQDQFSGTPGPEALAGQEPVLS